MQKAIEAIFEDGVFKPTKKVAFPEHARLRLIVLGGKEAAPHVARKQAAALLSLAGTGASGLGDVSENPEKYLYGLK